MMWARATREERSKMFLASSPGYRKEILTWAPDVPCSQAETDGLTASLYTPVIIQDEAVASPQLLAWMASEHTQFGPDPQAPPHALTPHHSGQAQSSPPPQTPPSPPQPEASSHNWTEGARIGEASNPGPNPATTTATILPLLETLQQLLHNLHLLCHQSSQTADPQFCTPPHTPPEVGGDFWWWWCVSGVQGRGFC